MFFRIFKYELLVALRSKTTVFWTLCFPLILGTLFYVAFSDIYESTEVFSAVPAAVVEQKENEGFSLFLQAVGEGDDAMLDAQITDEKSALKLLEKGDVSGIIYVGDDISLTVSEEGINQTIIKALLDGYKVNEKIITDAAKNNPQKIADVTAALQNEIDCNTQITLTDGNQDMYVQYFYNLIAMSCLYGSLFGLNIVVKTQANLSDLGARKSLSPVHKLTSVGAALLAAALVTYLCNAAALTYLLAVLKINFGSSAPALYVVTLAGSVTGVSLGFLVGAVGKASEGIKITGLAVVMLFLCFMSGLMVADMRQTVEQNFPWFNRINPAALISDSFYSLNIYSTSYRLVRNIVTLAAISVVCMVGGYILTRRRRYASL